MEGRRWGVEWVIGPEEAHVICPADAHGWRVVICVKRTERPMMSNWQKGKSEVRRCRVLVNEWLLAFRNGCWPNAVKSLRVDLVCDVK